MQFGPSEVLASLGVIIGFLSWRISRAGDLIRLVAAVIHARDFGYRIHRARMNKLLVVCRWLLWLTGIVTGVCILGFGFSYLRSTVYLLEISDVTDSLIRSTLETAANHDRQSCVNLSIGFFNLIVLDVTLGSLLEFAVMSGRSYHLESTQLAWPEAIPAIWSGAPTGMWIHRLQGCADSHTDKAIRESLQSHLETGAWRNEWSAWTQTVTVYRARCLASTLRVDR